MTQNTAFLEKVYFLVCCRTFGISLHVPRGRLDTGDVEVKHAGRLQSESTATPGPGSWALGLTGLPPPAPALGSCTPAEPQLEKQQAEPGDQGASLRLTEGSGSLGQPHGPAAAR